MATKQVFSARLDNGSSSAANYLGPMAAPQWKTTTPGVPWMSAGTFKNYAVTHASAPGSGKSFVYTFVKNGVDTSLTITLADLNTSASSVGTATVAETDVCYWRRAPSGTPTVSSVKIRGEFWNLNDNETAYGASGQWNSTTTYRTSLFNQGQWNSSSVDYDAHEPVCVPGTVTDISIVIDGAPGGGKSYTFVVYKNGVKQDGSGGSVNTTITISNSGLTGTWSGTLALAGGGRVCLEVVPSGTPATSAYVGVGIKFEPTTDGEPQGGGLVFENLPSSGSGYAAPGHWSDNWDTTESVVEALSGVSTEVVLRNLRTRTGFTIGTGPCTFAIRVGGSTSALTLTMTSGQSTGADTTHSVTLPINTAWSMLFTATGSPGIANIASMSFAMFAQYTPVVTSTLVFGGDTSVSGVSGAIAIGLDGNTNTLDEAGVMKLFGNMSVTGYFAIKDGITAPVAKVGEARVYIDVADGGLKIIFGDGTIKTIVTD